MAIGFVNIGVGCVVTGLVWEDTQLSKICFLYCFHNIEQTATVKNNAVINAIAVIISPYLCPNIKRRIVP
jgi:hypothetical protein